MKAINFKKESGINCLGIGILIVAILIFFKFIFGLLPSAIRTGIWLFIVGYIVVKLKLIQKVIALINGDKTAKIGKEEEFLINGTTTIENPYAGVFICGGAGSGKSKSLIEPLIKQAGQKQFTGVVYDFKFPELAQYVETAYRDTGVEPYYFNFQDISRSNRINPIAPELMENDSYAREFAFTILSNLNPAIISKPDFWSDNATSLLSAVFWYLRTKWKSYCTLPHAISLILQPNFKALLYELQSVPKCADMIAPILTAHEQGAENQLAGVLSSLQVSLSKINIDEIYYLMTANDFDLKVNESDNKSILVLGNNPQLSSTYAPIIGLILSSISKQLNRPGKEKSIFMVDEFPTVYIPNVEQLPATARSNKVATILACQDIAQLVDKYGRDKAETILSNLGNQFYGRTTNPTTAKRVSDIFGREEKITKSKTKEIDDWFDKSTTTSTRESDRVKAQHVAQLNTGSFFTILSEGKIRQGKSDIKMDMNFKKSEIMAFSSAGEWELEQHYKKVKGEVLGTILKKAITITS